MLSIGTLVLPIATVLPLGSRAEFEPADVLAVERQRILDAIRVVETGGLIRPTYPDGDGGRSIGPLQIGRSYWEDALAFDPSIGGCYEQCRKRAYAECVVRAYMQRYVPEAWGRADAEIIARTHNGGPRGLAKRSTLGYWEKVRAVLGDLD